MKKKKPGKSRSFTGRIPRPQRASSQPPEETPETEPEGVLRLNKYLSRSGVCSRRQAVELIKKGQVSVNGEVLKEPFYEVQEGDQVSYKGKLIQPAQTFVYILMNKPKGYITTMKDDRGRKTVMDLLDTDIQERIFPVGRLDRDTTGLLLLTNDGDLATKLAHPSHEVRKVYEVHLDQPVTPEHLQQIREGLMLEDGPAPVDSVDYVQGKTPRDIGISIHIGRNRIVRRIFEHLGYEVIRLDRTFYAGLTKKDLPRKFFRHLSHQEVIMLKHFT